MAPKMMSERKCCFCAKEIKVYLNKHKVGASFLLLFVAAMQTAACRSAPLPAPWRQGGWRIITWRPCVHRKWRGGGQLHVVYLLLVALPANHIDFTVARKGNFMIRLRANWVTFHIMQKLEIYFLFSSNVNVMYCCMVSPVSYNRAGHPASVLYNI
jgi:hypothetical protein